MQGLPVTWHTSVATWTLSPGLRIALRPLPIVGLAFSVAFAWTPSMKSSTTAETG